MAETYKAEVPGLGLGVIQYPMTIVEAWLHADNFQSYNETDTYKAVYEYTDDNGELKYWPFHYVYDANDILCVGGKRSTTAATTVEAPLNAIV